MVDLELTGLNARADEIISFAAVPVEAGRVVAGAAVNGLCRPTRRVPDRSVLIHGLRGVDLAEAPRLDEALPSLLAAMAGRVLVAHVAWVERSFLRRALARQGVRLRGPVVDTHQLGRLWAYEQGRRSSPEALDELATSLGLPVHRQHDALGDAMTTAQVFVALATLLDGRSEESVGSLAVAQSRCKFLSA